MKRFILFVFILLAGCAVSLTKNAPSEAPPEHTRWVRSFTTTEFEQEVRREEAAALASEAKGAFLVREYPAPARWEDVKKKYPRMRLVWRFEPDGSAPYIPGVQQIFGPGFAVLDDAGQLTVIHSATGYLSSQSK